MAAAFERLQQLGTDKFTKILNSLMRGQPAMNLAREIQQDWGDYTDVAEKTLTQQLNRLRLAAARGAFGKKIAYELSKGQTHHLPAFNDLSISAMERLEELAGVQRLRVLQFAAKEKAAPPTSGPLLQSVNAVFSEYAKLLLDIQKLRFELGLDEFKGVYNARGASASVTLPDGTNIHRQVFEAVASVEEIFKRRSVPKQVPAP